MDSTEKKTTTTKFVGRIRKSWLPLAAVAGALTSFVAASFRTRSEPEDAGSAESPEPSIKPGPTDLPTVTPVELKRTYTLTDVLGGDTSSLPFRRSLADIAVGAEDRIYSLGDDEIRIFDTHGKLVRSWRVIPKAGCLAVGPDGRTYVGALGRVEIYSANGVHEGGISIEEGGKPAAVTAIKIFGDEILVADATAGIIHRYDPNGKKIGTIGDQSKTGSFRLPNHWLDFDLDQYDIIWATDTGRYKVTGWMLDGSPIYDFGKFGMRHPADFVGCCNPVNLAVAPNGDIVTAEKMISRVKVYNQEGVLLALIGPENFDPKCTNIHLAVDSGGRILAADPIRREIKIFSPENGE